MLSIFEAKFTLQALAVKSNVPVCGIINKVEKSRNNGVKTIR